MIQESLIKLLKLEEFVMLLKSSYIHAEGVITESSLWKDLELRFKSWFGIIDQILKAEEFVKLLKSHYIHDKVW